MSERDARIDEVLQDIAKDAETGDLAHKFLKGKVGRYLIDQALIDEEQAFQEFLEVDPQDAHAVRAIQERGRSPKVVIAWLQDAIRKGAAADQQLAIAIEEAEQ